MSVYQVTLSTLTPIHIGDGVELAQDFDFSVFQGRTYRLNEDTILAAKIEQMRPDAQGHYSPPGRLLAERDYQVGKYFRYILAGFPRSRRTDARLRSFIKDPFDRPYIPGSSLKGAFRTALAWTAWKEINPRLERNAIGNNKSWAGQPLERKIFGRDPNHDLLRALQVSDFCGLDQPAQGLRIINAQVLTRRSKGSPIELEALAGDIVLHGTIKIDESLFSSQAEPELRFGNRKPWLDELPRRLQMHSAARIKRLLNWYETAENTLEITRFYRQLSQVNLPPNQALLQIGWGAGWDSKTFWTHLQSDSQLFEQLVREFRLHKAGRNTPPRKAGDPFPRSKRAVMRVKDGSETPVAPLGWVLIELKKE